MLQNIKVFNIVLYRELLPLNDRLYHMGIKNAQTCDLCRIEKETLGHFFYYCQFTQQLIKELVYWLKITNVE